MNKQQTKIVMLFFFMPAILFGIFIPTGHTYDRAIKEAQAILLNKGYSPGPADGLVGKKTTEAIRTFQTDNSLPSTGKLDVETRNSLGVKAKPLKRKAKREPVSLDCIVQGMNAEFADGGKTMVIGSIGSLTCGGDDIMLETNKVDNFHISTKEYGKLKFSAPSFNTPGIVFYLSENQKKILEKYIK